MEKDFIKIGNDVFSVDAILEVYIGTNDGKLYVFTDNTEFDYDPAEYNVEELFRKIVNYLNIVEDL